MKLNNKLKFGSKAHMSETLTMAYKHILDECAANLHGPDFAGRRLNKDLQKELGRRLANYFINRNSLTK